MNNWQNTPPGTKEALDMQTVNIIENFYTSKQREQRAEELEAEGFTVSNLAKPWLKKEHWIFSLSASKYLYREGEEAKLL